jgi:hypothetical protein
MYNVICIEKFTIQGYPRWLFMCYCQRVIKAPQEASKGLCCGLI